MGSTEVEQLEPEEPEGDEAGAGNEETDADEENARLPDEPEGEGWIAPSLKHLVETDEAAEELPEGVASLLTENGRKALINLRKYVAGKKEEVLGDHAAHWQNCIMCSYFEVPGYMPSEFRPEDLKQEVLTWAHGGPPPVILEDEFSKPCAKCGGLGIVLTGSKVPGQESLPCLACKGMGWMPVGPERASGVFATANGPAAQPPALSTVPAPGPAESPEIAAAKQLLISTGRMVIDPIPTLGA